MLLTVFLFYRSGRTTTYLEDIVKGLKKYFPLSYIRYPDNLGYLNIRVVLHFVDVCNGHAVLHPSLMRLSILNAFTAFGIHKAPSSFTCDSFLFVV